MDCNIYVAKTKAQISCAFTAAQLTCVFVFACAKSRVSHDTAQIRPYNFYLIQNAQFAACLDSFVSFVEIYTCRLGACVLSLSNISVCMSYMLVSRGPHGRFVSPNE